MNKKGKKTGGELATGIDALSAPSTLTAKAASELAEAVSGLDDDPEFLTAYWKSKFVEYVLAAMAEQKCSRKELAKRLDTSSQYVSRILNESANFTIETMVRFAVALGRRPYFGMCCADERVKITSAAARHRESAFPRASNRRIRRAIMGRPGVGAG